MNDAGAPPPPSPPRNGANPPRRPPPPASPARGPSGARPGGRRPFTPPKKKIGGTWIGVGIVIFILAGASFIYATHRYQETPAQVWARIVATFKSREVAPPEAPAANEAEPPPSPLPPEPQAPSASVGSKDLPPPMETILSPAQPILTAAELALATEAGPDSLAWLAKNRNRWPRKIALRDATEFPVIVDGKVAGSVVVPEGGQVDFVGFTSDQVTVKHLGASLALRLDATDLRAQADLLLRASSRRMPAPPLPNPEETPRVAEKKEWKGFVHPGLLHTEEDFKRMRAMVQAERSPWIEGWHVLTRSAHAQLGWRPRPVGKVIRGAVPGQNSALLFKDAHAAYQLALRWKISGDRAYAENAIEILNAWSSTLKEVAGNADRFLAAGIYGYQFANAAEIMRGYPGWKRSDFKRFQDLMLEVFLVQNERFLFGRDGGADHNGAAITNYWANWDLCNIACMQAIGVLCDRKDVYDRAVDYAKYGRGNGSLMKAVYFVHDGYLGQWQETGRDQGHTTLGIALMGPIMEAAWNQGDDLYGFENNRFLAGAEYVAKYCLGHDVPFMRYAWGSGPRGDWREQTRVAGEPGFFRAGYELVVNHYVNRKGISAPYSEAYARRLRPEGAPGGHASAFDQFGLGTLTMTRPPEVARPVPGGLTVIKRDGKPVLSWWGAAGAESYHVKRSPTPGGPYTLAAAGIKDLFSWTDGGTGAGKEYFVVTAVSGDKESEPSNEVSFSWAPALVTHLTFDEFRGEVAEDKIANANPGTLHGGAKWTRGPIQNAVALDGKNGHVSLPEGVVSHLSDFTISTWVYLNGSQPRARLFDFGDDNGIWMFLELDKGDGAPRFGLSAVYHYNEQRIDGQSRIPTGRWVHAAVTLSGTDGRLYIDGALSGVNSQIDFQPFRLGRTRHNWLGRSRQAGAPYLDGTVDDLRIYDEALSAEAVAGLAKSGRR